MVEPWVVPVLAKVKVNLVILAQNKIRESRNSFDTFYILTVPAVQCLHIIVVDFGIRRISNKNKQCLLSMSNWSIR